MIIEAIKKGEGYFIPINGKKEKIKVDILDEDVLENFDEHTIRQDMIEDTIVAYYEEKRKNYIEETIDIEIFKKFLKINNLEEK